MRCIVCALAVACALRRSKATITVQYTREGEWMKGANGDTSS